MNHKYIYSLYIILFIIIFLICITTTYLYSSDIFIFDNSNIKEHSFIFSNEEFCWPIPGFHKITSYFGPRVSPTNGASSNHSGIDVAAPQGTVLYAITSGKIIFTGFSGANGHTVKMQSGSLTILYCHVSPQYIVSVGDSISKGEQIANVGPKYIIDVLNNPYKDSTGKATNGALTGTHLHLTIKKDGIAVNPLDFFQ